MCPLQATYFEKEIYLYEDDDIYMILVIEINMNTDKMTSTYMNYKYLSSLLMKTLIKKTE